MLLLRNLGSECCGIARSYDIGSPATSRRMVWSDRGFGGSRRGCRWWASVVDRM